MRAQRGRTKSTIYDAVHQKRWGDAHALFKAKRWNGAIYLAGYVIECLLKVAVCLRQGVSALPAEFEIHNYDVLARAAGLEPPLRQNQQARTDYRFLCDRWNVSVRSSGKDYSRKETEEFLGVVRRFKRWLEEQMMSMR